jgi:site-specific DNA recombinase
VLHEYSDKAISGTTDHRPQFQQMIKDSGKKLWQYVLVYKVDRSARDWYDSANYRAKLKRNGVKVLSAKRKFPMGRRASYWNQCWREYAEYCIANLAQNIHRGMVGNALNCKFNGARRLLGYRSTSDGTIIVDASETVIVRYIFSHFVAGDSQSEIIRQLNAKGLENRSAKLSRTQFCTMKNILASINLIAHGLMAGFLPLFLQKDLPLCRKDLT